MVDQGLNALAEAVQTMSGQALIEYPAKPCERDDSGVSAHSTYSRIINPFTPDTGAQRLDGMDCLSARFTARGRESGFDLPCPDC